MAGMESINNTMDARLDNDALIYYQQAVLDDVQNDIIHTIYTKPFTEDCRRSLLILVKEQFSREYVVNNYDKFDVFRTFLTMREKMTTMQAETRPVNLPSLQLIISLIEGHAANKLLRSSDKGSTLKNQQSIYTHNSVEDRTRIDERSGLSSLFGRRS